MDVHLRQSIRLIRLTWMVFIDREVLKVVSLAKNSAENIDT